MLVTAAWAFTLNLFLNLIKKKTIFNKDSGKQFKLNIIFIYIFYNIAE